MRQEFPYNTGSFPFETQIFDVPSISPGYLRITLGNSGGVKGTNTQRPWH